MEKELQLFIKSVDDNIQKRRYQPAPLDHFHQFPLALDQAMYVLDFKNKRVSFQKGIKEFLGYSKAEFTFEKALTNYHPNDSEMVNRLLRATIGYVMENSSANHNVSYFLTSRIKHKDGSYIKALRQSTVFETDVDGNMISNISILSDISFIDTSDKVQWKFRAPGLDEEKFRKYVSQEYRNFFSARETEVLRLLTMGLTSELVAEKLHISKHTVDGHRRKMLEKSHCTNTVELINFSRTNGII